MMPARCARSIRRPATEKWTLPGHGPGYASPIVTTSGGVAAAGDDDRQGGGGDRGAVRQALWTIPFPDEWNENIVTPVVAGDMLIVSGTRKGTFGYRLEKTGGGLDADARSGTTPICRCT